MGDNKNTDAPIGTHFPQNLEKIKWEDSEICSVIERPSNTPIREIESSMLNRNSNDFYPITANITGKISIEEETTKIKQCTVNVIRVNEANTCTKSAVRKSGKVGNSTKGLQSNIENPDTTKVQIKVSKQVRCSDCNYTTSRTANMNRHIQHVHLKIKSSKKYKCNECNYCTVYKWNLKTHRKAIHLKIKDNKCKYCS